MLFRQATLISLKIQFRRYVSVRVVANGFLNKILCDVEIFSQFPRLRIPKGNSVLQLIRRNEFLNCPFGVFCVVPSLG